MARVRFRAWVRVRVRNAVQLTVTHSGSRPEAVAIAAVRVAMDDALTVPELPTSEDASAFIKRTTGGGGEDGGGTDGGSGEGGDCGLYIGGGGGGDGGDGDVFLFFLFYLLFFLFLFFLLVCLFFLFGHLAQQCFPRRCLVSIDRE